MGNRPVSLPALRSVVAALVVLVPFSLGVAAYAQAEPVLEWSDLYDGGANLTDLGTAALADPEGNVIVAGESGDGIAGSDMLIRKLARETRETIWTRRVPFIDTNDMALSGMVWDPAGNILVGGYSRGCVG